MAPPQKAEPKVVPPPPKRMKIEPMITPKDEIQHDDHDEIGEVKEEIARDDPYMDVAEAEDAYVERVKQEICAIQEQLDAGTLKEEEIETASEWEKI